MSRLFVSPLPLRGIVPIGGTIARVSRSPFASGDAVASCATIALRKCMRIGAIPGLHTGDIIKIHPDGTIYRLWDRTSLHNCLYVTNACNFRCLMCPQPPRADEPSQHTENLRVLKLLDSDTEMIGITGGEPTLFPERLEEYFRLINKRFPNVRVEILTNGSVLSDFDIAKSLALEAPMNTCWCVSLHGDTPSLAESVMQCSNGWDKALHGIINLAKLQQQIEIRVVITQNNAQYIEDIARFIYRNFPFASHVAFMGQEIVGAAEANYARIWIEPTIYANGLDAAVRFLDAMRIKVSIYNIPLCILHKTSRSFARRSISDWKQCYCSQCGKCDARDECCGFFETSGDRVPRGIHELNDFALKEK